MAIDMYIDDGTGICSSKGEESSLKARIQKFYKIKEKDTSKPFKVLGILVTRDTHLGTLKLSQSEYIDSMLQRFNMTMCNPVNTPIDKGSHLQNDMNEPYENIKEYQALTRSLTYATMSMCPVYHAIPVAIKQKPYSAGLECREESFTIPQRDEKPGSCVQEEW